MHNSHSRSRRAQDSAMDDDDVMSRLASRRVQEDHHDRGRSTYAHAADYNQHPPSDAYQRHSTYNTETTAPRQRDSGWHSSENPRSNRDSYYAQDSYQRSGRGEYENDGGWQSRPSAQYSNSNNRDWNDNSSYNNKPSFNDSGWSQSSSSKHDRHAAYPETWDRDSSRTTRGDDRGNTQGNQGHRWRRDDSNWSSRGRGKERNEPSRPTRSDTVNATTSDDRLWQPAPNWQQNQFRQGDSNGQQGRFQNGRTGNQGHSNTYKKGPKKKNKKSVKSQGNLRGAQNDDVASINNWQRKDNANDSRNHHKGQNTRQSRSRSISSASSRHSSHRRSRSRSPQNRKRPHSHSHSPEKARETKANDKSRRQRSYSRSRSRSPDRTRRRARYPSTDTSRSPSRSPSRSRSPSPIVKPKAVHRLPQATPLSSITLTRNQAMSMAPPRSRLKGFQTSSTVSASIAEGNNDSVLPVQPNLSPKAPEAVPDTPPILEDRNAEASPSISDTSPAHGKPGFRPIGKSTSALKRFFPGDETDPAAEAEDTITPAMADSTTMDASADTTPSIRASSSNAMPAPTPNQPAAHAVTAAASAPPARSSRSKPGQLYSIVTQVGEGTFGKVYKARNTVTGAHVALKRIRMEAERDGFPVTAMREIKLLQSLSNENVVRLHEMMVSDGHVFMVFEYMEHDLTGVLSQSQFVLSPAHLKSFCQQMLQGLAYLHHKSVVHRDIKGSNILVSNRGVLKLADFGLARWYQKRRKADYTNRVITLWYRPPELLLGATVYGPEVDMWSAGCIMLQLFTKKEVFQGNDEIHQLDVIYKIFGTLTAERWAGVADLPWFELVKAKDTIPNSFRTLFQKWLSPAALDLAEALLAYDPEARASAVQALEAPYFHAELPQSELPIGLADLQGEWHELETKKERAKKRRKTEGSGSGPV